MNYPASASARRRWSKKNFYSSVAGERPSNQIVRKCHVSGGAFLLEPDS